MKKTLTLFCVASAAALQALTLDWATDNHSRSIAAGEDFSIVTTYTPSAATFEAWVTIVSIGAYDVDGNWIDDVLRVQQHPGETAIRVYGNVQDDHSDDANQHVATSIGEALRIVVNKEGTTVSVHVNGENALTFDINQSFFGDATNYVVHWGANGDPDSESAIAPPDGTIGDSGTYDDALTDWEIGEVSTTPTSIPRPSPSPPRWPCWPSAWPPWPSAAAPKRVALTPPLLGPALRRGSLFDLRPRDGRRGGPGAKKNGGRAPPLGHALQKIGSEGRIRTCDQVINSHLRYHCATSDCGMFSLPFW